AAWGPAASPGPGPRGPPGGGSARRLAVATSPGPAEVIDKIRIPASFSPRSPQHRRDLASTMRNRIGSDSTGGRGGVVPPGGSRASADRPHRTSRRQDEPFGTGGGGRQERRRPTPPG